MKRHSIILAVLLTLVSVFGFSTSVKASTNTSDVTGILYARKQTTIYNLNDQGDFAASTSRALGPESAWYYNQLKEVNFGENSDAAYYHVATNEWVKRDINIIAPQPTQKLPGQVDNYFDSDAKVITVKNNVKAPVYDSYGDKTGKFVDPNTAWRTDQLYVIGTGFPVELAAHRIGINEWLSTEDTNVTARF